MAQLETGKLFDLLERQVQVADDLLAILDAELAAVIAVDITGLMTVTRKKQQQVTRMLTLDNAIYEVVEAGRENRAAAPSPAPAGRGPRITPVTMPRSIRLSDLLPQIPPAEGRRLASLRDEIVRRRQEIDTKNRASKRLIAETLGYLGDAIGLITGKIAEEQYRYTGKLRDVKGRPPVFISRSV